MRGNSTGKHRPKKRFGQNFLTDNSIIDDIIEAAKIESGDAILEIGPGRGALTHLLAKRAGRLIAVEIDWDLADALTAEFAGNDTVSIVQGDILKMDLDSLLPTDGPLKVVANLPYYITTPILMMLLESGHVFEKIIVMVQKEVALRMCADAGSSDYGALSLAVSFYTNPSIVVDVPASCFYPAPKVDSCVVALEKKERICEGKEKDRLFALIKAAFLQRRKTLVNAVAAAGIADKNTIGAALNSLGFKENIRGEALNLQDFFALSKELSKQQEI